MPLSDTKVRSAKPRDAVYRLTDADGLCIEIRPSGTKTWRLRYRLDGKANMHTIGTYPAVSLSAARERRDWGRALIARGIHPRDEVEREKRRRIADAGATFGSVAEEWFTKRSDEWTDYYATQVRRGLDQDILPVIGKRPIKEVGAQDVLSIMQSTEKRGAKTVAVLLRQWMSAVFRYGIVTLRSDEDPALHVKGAVKRNEVKHAVDLNESQLRHLMAQIEVFGGYRTTQLAIRFLLLTMVRTIEMRRARWDEIDLEARLWRLPEESMKRRQKHLVPLSDQVVAILEELRDYTGGGGILFPGMKNPRQPIHLTTINQALGRMGFGKGEFSAHGFRATASTHMNEHGWSPDAIERQLAHVPGNRTRKSYNHAQYLDERRRMLQWWADYIDGLAGR